MHKRKQESYIYLLFALPTIIYLLLFKFIPFLGNIIAFMDYKILKGIIGSEFVGLKHFKKLFESEIFLIAIR